MNKSSKDDLAENSLPKAKQLNSILIVNAGTFTIRIIHLVSVGF